MQWIGALLAAGGCALLGALCARRLDARERAMEFWENALARMASAVEAGGAGLPGARAAAGPPGVLPCGGAAAVPVAAARGGRAAAAAVPQGSPGPPRAAPCRCRARSLFWAFCSAVAGCSGSRHIRLLGLA